MKQSSLFTIVHDAVTIPITCATRTIPAVMDAVKMTLWPRLSSESDVACLSPASWYRAMHSSYRWVCQGVWMRAWYSA